MVGQAVAAVAVEAWPTAVVVVGPGGRARSLLPRAPHARPAWFRGGPAVAVVSSAVLLRLRVVVAMLVLVPGAVVRLEAGDSGTPRVGCVGVAADSCPVRVHSVVRTRRCRPPLRLPRRSRRSRQGVDTSDDGGSTGPITRSGRGSVGR